MSTPITLRNAKLADKVVKALKERYFEAFYCNNREEALELALSLIPREDVVSWGGSETVAQTGLLERVKEKYRVIDRDTANNPEERFSLMRQALLADTYLTGANAISEDGQLVNIDGNGNRVAAMIYGPQNVIVIAGMNKVVKTADDALVRARTIAAPINAQRFPALNTPCMRNGTCSDCKSVDSICSCISVIRLSRPAGKIKVILIGEELGF
jgi:hypothetical protein